MLLGYTALPGGSTLYRAGHRLNACPPRHVTGLQQPTRRSRRGRTRSNAQAVSSLNPWRTLGVSEDADEQQIKQAFRTLAKEHHPDVNKSGEAHWQFLKIHEAYSILSGKTRSQDLPSKKSSGDWEFHDWYWKFVMNRRWDKQRNKSTASTAGAPQPSSAPKSQLHTQLAGLKRKAAFRKAKSSSPVNQAAGVNKTVVYHTPCEAAHHTNYYTTHSKTGSAAFSEDSGASSSSQGVVTEQSPRRTPVVAQFLRILLSPILLMLSLKQAAERVAANPQLVLQPINCLHFHLEQLLWAPEDIWDLGSLGSGNFVWAQVNLNGMDGSFEQGQAHAVNASQHMAGFTHSLGYSSRLRHCVPAIQVQPEKSSSNNRAQHTAPATESQQDSERALVLASCTTERQQEEGESHAKQKAYVPPSDATSRLGSQLAGLRRKAALRKSEG